MLSILLPKNQESTVMVHYEIQGKSFKSQEPILVSIPSSDLKVESVRWKINYDSHYLFDSTKGQASVDSVNISHYHSGSLVRHLVLKHHVLTAHADPLVHTLNFYPQFSQKWRGFSAIFLLLIVALFSVFLGRKRYIKAAICVFFLVPISLFLKYNQWLNEDDIQLTLSVGAIVYVGTHIIIWIKNTIQKTARSSGRLTSTYHRPIVKSRYEEDSQEESPSVPSPSTSQSGESLDESSDASLDGSSDEPSDKSLDASSDDS